MNNVYHFEIFWKEVILYAYIIKLARILSSLLASTGLPKATHSPSHQMKFLFSPILKPGQQDLKTALSHGHL